jgi:hypothetical protein
VSTLFLVFFVSLAILLAAGSLAIQGYIYNEPVGDIFWRAPAAAAVVTAFLGFWCFLNYRARDPKAQELPYEALFTSVGGEDAGQAERELWAERAGGKTHYRRYTITGVVDRYEYHDSNNKRLAHDKNIEAIIVKEGDPKQPVEVRFIAKHDEDKYVEEGGSRFMTVANFGRIYTPRPGRSRVMLFLNALHFAVWFLTIWLLLRFQWSHALGLAAAIWLAMTMLVGPLIFAKIPRREPPAPTALFSRSACAALATTRCEHRG